MTNPSTNALLSIHFPDIFDLRQYIIVADTKDVAITGIIHNGKMVRTQGRVVRKGQGSKTRNAANITASKILRSEIL